jgi:hypothetical protein
MTNDLAIKENPQIIIVQQENMILKLRMELQKLQAQKASRLDDSLFSPNLFDHYKSVAETLAKSGVIPNAYKNKPEDIFVAMAMGYQLGFPVEQALQDIAVINGRPCLWGDGLMALVLVHPECEAIEEEPVYSSGVVTGYICTVKRKGHKPHSKTFTIQDATNAGLVAKGGVWKNYPERMLQLRARAYALRDKFADALRGIHQAEVEEDNANTYEGEVIKSSIEDNSQVEKLKMILKNNSKTEEKKTESKKKEPEDNSPISEDDVLQIQCMMDERGFDEVRKLKAMDYFKVTKLSDLTASQAKVFKLQLSRA